jgi:hypothetical protein
MLNNSSLANALYKGNGSKLEEILRIVCSMKYIDQEIRKNTKNIKVSSQPFDVLVSFNHPKTVVQVKKTLMFLASQLFLLYFFQLITGLHLIMRYTHTVF